MWPLRGSTSPPGDRFHDACGQELGQGRFGYPDMAAHSHEPDAAFGDEPTREALASPEQFGDLSDSEKPPDLGSRQRRSPWQP